jgi:hypothetical protein
VASGGNAWDRAGQISLMKQPFAHVMTPEGSDSITA